MNLDRLFGDKSSFPMEHRMLNMVLVLAIVIAVANCVINFCLGYSLLFAVSILSVFILSAMYWLSVFKRRYMATAVLLVTIYGAVVPVMWVYDNGILGGSTYYTIMYASLLAVFLNGLTRGIALSIFTVTMVMLIERDNNIEQYANLYLGLFSALVVLTLFYIIVKKCYYEESIRSRDYLLQIENQKTQLKMIRLDRLNLVGEMAASIGHEVRNPLTTVRGYLQMFQRNQKFAEHGAQFELMIDELDRANLIISEFLSLAKNKVIQLKPDNLNRIVQVISPLLNADSLRLGKQLAVELNDIPDLLLDENEIRQCIINFVRNGFEAIEGEGWVSLRTFREGECVVLSVRDNGKGIPEEVYGKLGTPFITTKPDGTGLGIPICYKIAERHNAKIEVKTGSQGTTFLMKFERAVESCESAG